MLPFIKQVMKVSFFDRQPGHMILTNMRGRFVNFFNDVSVNFFSPLRFFIVILVLLYLLFIFVYTRFLCSDMSRSNINSSVILSFVDFLETVKFNSGFNA